jgi:hypothetical protein
VEVAAIDEVLKLEVFKLEVFKIERFEQLGSDTMTRCS